MEWPYVDARSRHAEPQREQVAASCHLVGRLCRCEPCGTEALSGRLPIVVRLAREGCCEDFSADDVNAHVGARRARTASVHHPTFDADAASILFSLPGYRVVSATPAIGDQPRQVLIETIEAEGASRPVGSSPRGCRLG